jgi:hypothetical protein
MDRTCPLGSELAGAFGEELMGYNHFPFFSILMLLKLCHPYLSNIDQNHLPLDFG